jgi:uncharacterized protein (TIRG00374 family)
MAFVFAPNLIDMKKHILRIGVSTALILYFMANLDWEAIKNSFLSVKIDFYLISTLLTLLSSLILACKYYFMIRNTQLSTSIHRLIIINFISRFYALFLPTAVGPEIVRWYKVTKNKNGKALFFASTIVERFFFFLFLVSFGFLPLYFQGDNSEIAILRQRLAPFVILIYLIIVLSIAYFTSQTFHNFIKSLINKKFKLNANSRIMNFLENFSLDRTSLAFLYPTIILSLIWQFFFIFRTFFLFLAMDLPFTIINAAWMGSLVFLLQTLPISFAGIGIREGAFVYLFSLYSVSSEAGLTIGLLLFSQMLILAAIGAVCMIFDK